MRAPAPARRKIPDPDPPPDPWVSRLRGYRVTMNVQYWQVSGYEANAEIEDEPVTPGGLHRGTAGHDGATVWVHWDEVLRRWQEIDPSLAAEAAEAAGTTGSAEAVEAPGGR